VAARFDDAAAHAQQVVADRFAEAAMNCSFCM